MPEFSAKTRRKALEAGKKARAPAVPRSTSGELTGDYRHDATRTNSSPAGLSDLDQPPPRPTKKCAYDSHLDPELQWSEKAKHTSFEVDTVSLQVHERNSAQAIMHPVKWENAQRSPFDGDELPESKAIDICAHEVGWANRLVLACSLVVMDSLSEREQMAGKVQSTPRAGDAEAGARYHRRDPRLRYRALRRFRLRPRGAGDNREGHSRPPFRFVNAAPDILVGDLVKTSKTNKLTTVFGLPDATGETHHDDGVNVAAWFLDHDYDGRTFCVSWAFFRARLGTRSQGARRRASAPSARRSSMRSSAPRRSPSSRGWKSR